MERPAVGVMDVNVPIFNAAGHLQMLDMAQYTAKKETYAII
jgi:hypothetical protein